MKAEELNELGYSLINEYTCGKWYNLVMNLYRKKRFRIYISYHKKTGKDILLDAKLLVEEAEKLKKKRLSLTFYTDAIKIVKVMNEDEVGTELVKAKAILKQTLNSFNTYLNNFTQFRRKDDDQHKKDVKKHFNKAFQISKMKSRIKHLEYILS